MNKRGNHSNLIDLNAAPPKQPPAPVYTPRPIYHGDDCACESCCSIRAAMDLYLDAKRNLNVNNWWNS